MSHPTRLVTLDIDGLRADVFRQALRAGQIPNLARVLGGANGSGGLLIPAVSSAPAITFCCQTTLFTGAHPAQHGIVGNQFFDRTGRTNGGHPRFYAFDIGDTLEIDDAIQVFVGSGLLNAVVSPHTPTLYELARIHGRRALVGHHMLSRGAEQWIQPNLIYMARLTKGGQLLGIDPEVYDRKLVEKTAQALQAGFTPDLLTLHFLGLDHQSHAHGPAAQLDYLVQVVDEQIGQLLGILEQRHMLAGCLFAIVSDHGQLKVPGDDQHSLRVSFPFDRELGALFQELGLDVHNYPGEGPDSEAVIASNGGLAHIYLTNQQQGWAVPPSLAKEVLPVARAFWQANTAGRYAPALRGSLDAILVRDVEREGWYAPYRAYTAEQGLINVGEYLSQHPEIEVVDPVHRLAALSGPASGDILLWANWRERYYFASPHEGIHGGLHPEDSYPVFALGWPDGGAAVASCWESVQALIQQRCQAEDGRLPNLVDFVPAVLTVLGLEQTR